MKNREPAILIPAPFPPTLCYPLQVLPCTEPSLDRMIRKTSGRDPFSPKRTPPLPLLLRAIAPRPGTAFNILPLEARLTRPDMDPRARVRIAPSRLRDAHMQILPLPQDRHIRIPGHARTLPQGHDAALPSHPAHLPQALHRIPDVLQHLVRVHDVEAPVRELQRVHIPDAEVDILHLLAGGVGPRRLERRGEVFNAGEVPRWHELGEIYGDGARPAPNIEDLHVWFDGGQEVGDGVLGGAPGVHFQHGRVVVCYVNGHFWCCPRAGY